MREIRIPRLAIRRRERRARRPWATSGPVLAAPRYLERPRQFEAFQTFVNGLQRG